MIPVGSCLDLEGGEFNTSMSAARLSEGSFQIDRLTLKHLKGFDETRSIRLDAVLR
jgi:hypothetical protein